MAPSPLSGPTFSSSSSSDSDSSEDDGHILSPGKVRLTLSKGIAPKAHTPSVKAAARRQLNDDFEDRETAAEAAAKYRRRSGSARSPKKGEVSPQKKDNSLVSPQQAWHSPSPRRASPPAPLSDRMKTVDHITRQATSVVGQMALTSSSDDETFPPSRSAKGSVSPPSFKSRRRSSDGVVQQDQGGDSGGVSKEQQIIKLQHYVTSRQEKDAQMLEQIGDFSPFCGVGISVVEKGDAGIIVDHVTEGRPAHTEVCVRNNTVGIDGVGIKEVTADVASRLAGKEGSIVALRVEKADGGGLVSPVQLTSEQQQIIHEQGSVELKKSLKEKVSGLESAQPALPSAEQELANIMMSKLLQRIEGLELTIKQQHHDALAENRKQMQVIAKIQASSSAVESAQGKPSKSCQCAVS